MKKNGLLKQTASYLLAFFFVCTLFPFHAAALPAGMEFGGITGSTNSIKASNQLSDGEVYTYTKTTGVSGSQTDFNVELSALGQQYQTKTKVTQSYNIVFVLDVSGSMNDNGKAQTMVDTTNQAIASLTKSGLNQVGVVTFSQTASTLVSLTKNKFSLNYGYSYNYDYYYIKNVTSNNYTWVDGGTNIQAGLKQAYSVLKKDTNKDAIPVVILLSDGVPCYYCVDYTQESSNYLEDGKGYMNVSDGTTSNDGIKASAHTIKQAAYLKTQMKNLQIYTIGFDIGSNKLAAAMLNPLPENVQAVTSRKPPYWKQVKNWNGEDWVWDWVWCADPATPLSSFLGTDQSSYYYTNGYYTASNSVASLGTALNSIVEKLNVKKPIEEAATTAGLSDTSYVTMTYELGDAYPLPNKLTVTLDKTLYHFTKNGTNYSYDVPANSPSYNPAIGKLRITFSGKTLTWKIPSSVLPCNSPKPAAGETQTIVDPITLSFPAHFDDTNSSLTVGTYVAGKSCTASFAPALDNPYYYQTDAANTVSLTSSGFTMNYNTSVSPKTLKVTYSSKTETYKETDSIKILPNENGGYTVRALSPDKQTLTVTQFYVENNTLYKKVSTEHILREVSIASGFVTQTHTNFGSITLKGTSVTPEQCISSVTLKSKTNTNLATASSTGETNLVLTLRVDKPVSNLSFTLGCNANSSDSQFTQNIVSYQNISTTNPSPVQNGALPTTLQPGTYKITVHVKVAYTDAKKKPQSCMVNFDNLKFNFENTSLTLAANTNKTNQQVKVVLIPRLSH